MKLLQQADQAVFKQEELEQILAPIALYPDSLINRNIDRGKYATQYQGGRGNWQHSPEHRKGVSYRDQATGQKYNRASTNEAVKSREDFRGRSEASRQDPARGGADQTRGRQDAGQRSSLEGRTGTREAGGRDLSGQGGSAFSGMDRGGSATRDFSDRGSSSRQGMSSGSGGGGGRGGGAASRGGGGGGRGGGRR